MKWRRSVDNDVRNSHTLIILKSKLKKRIAVIINHKYFNVGSKRENIVTVTYVDVITS